MKAIPIGISNFEELRNNNYYFVDKTNMIQEFLERKSKVTLITRPRRFGKTLNMSMMASFFDVTKDSKYIFENFLVDKWLIEDRKLNNYVHANGIRFVMDNYIYQDKKENKDKELIETLQNITDIFLSLLSVIDSIKFHSSDYLDALEMGMKPQEGSQYWVCPIIVQYMNDRFDKKLLQYIQNNEGNGMQFMAEYYAD